MTTAGAGVSGVAVVFGMALGALGCAGHPTVGEAPAPTLLGTSGAPLTAVCLAEPDLYLLRPGLLERWRLDDEPPSREERRASARGRALRCGLGWAEVVGDETPRYAFAGDPAGTSGGPGGAEVEGQAGVWPTGPLQLHGRRWAVSWSAGGFTVERGGPLLVRRGPGVLRAAAYGGGRLWGLSEGALWMWGTPEAEPVPVSLPAEAAGREWVGLFLDVAGVWLRDEEGWGLPIAVEGPVARALAPPARLYAPPPPELRLPVGAWRARLALGAPGIEWLDARGRVTARTHTAGPVQAVLPRAGRLWVAIGEGVVLLRPTRGGAVIELSQTLSAPAVAIFDAGAEVLVVTARDGVRRYGQAPR